jgi:hypothetical protein
MTIKNKILFFALLLSVTLLIIGIPLLGVIYDHNFRKNGIYTLATIHERRILNTGERNGSEEVHIRFYDNTENEIIAVLNNGTTQKQEGERIEIWYSPGNPQNIRIRQDMAIIWYFLIAGGILGFMLVISGKLLLKAVIGKALKKRLMQEGHFIMADVTEIKKHNYSINSINPFLIRCEYKDVHKVYEFLNKASYTDPNPNITQDNQIKVWVDRKNFSKYYIDVD